MAEVAPVHLGLLSRRSLESDEGTLLALASPRAHGSPHLGNPTAIATLLDLHKETGRIRDTQLPAFPRIGAKWIDLPALRLPFILPWSLPQVLPNGLPVHVQLTRYLGNADSVVMQLLYLHETLQSQHPNPPRVRMLGFDLNWGFFNR